MRSCCLLLPPAAAVFLRAHRILRLSVQQLAAHGSGGDLTRRPPHATSPYPVADACSRDCSITAHHCPRRTPTCQWQPIQPVISVRAWPRCRTLGLCPESPDFPRQSPRRSATVRAAMRAPRPPVWLLTQQFDAAGAVACQWPNHRLSKRPAERVHRQIACAARPAVPELLQQQNSISRRSVCCFSRCCAASCPAALSWRQRGRS